MGDEFREMPDPTKGKLDFSGFHPLDHQLWQCRGYPGGRRTHLRYRWEFQWRSALRAQTWCRLGRHTPAQWWHPAEKSTWKACIDCGKRLSKPQPG